MKPCNPIIYGKGVCDPHMHIFNNKVYLYASHDSSPDNSNYVMHDWQVWSSPDMINWVLECTVKPEETYVGATKNCWATDAAFRNGKYYFYFSNGSFDTGVAVSSSPGGPFKDALGKPLLTEKLTPTRQYDPTVFVDDDANKTPYIIFGSPAWANADGYYITKLNEDMVSLAEPPKKIILKNPDGTINTADDKNWLHKRNGIYYLSWASYYATSDNVYGPYTVKGNIGASFDHGSFFEWNNQWFNAYTIFDPNMFHRATGLCYVHYKDNGEMAPADSLILMYGVGQYDAEWEKIESKWYMSASAGIQKRESPHGSFEITGITDSSYLFYPNIHNLKQDTSIYFFVSCGNSEGCTIEVHENSINGALLGSCKIPCTGNWERYAYCSVGCALRNTAGTNSLYFVFRGTGKELLRLEWFKFYNTNKY